MGDQSVPGAHGVVVSAPISTTPENPNSAVPKKGKVKRPKKRSLVGRIFGSFAYALAWLLILIGTVGYAAGRWSIKTFGYITPDQLRMNMNGAGEGGVGGADMVRDGVIHVLLIPGGVVLGLFLIWVSLMITTRAVLKTDRIGRRLLATMVALLAIAAPLAGAASVGAAVQIREYLAAQDPNLDIGAYYVSPTITDLNPEKKYNLVLIYLESVEESMARDDLLGENLLEGINQATSDWERIGYYEQYPNFGWTMAGVVATQCGVPLRAPSTSEIDLTEKNDAGILNGWDSSKYMDSAVCLGDILADAGYHNVYLGGASTNFAGKGTFLSNHGYQTVKGRDQWEKEGVEFDTAWWGPSDHTLMELAEEQILELRADGDPFSLTLLTVDTHEPAHALDYCKTPDPLRMETVAKCSLGEVAKFIDFLDSHGFMDDTVVIVMGDHQRMPGELDNKLSEVPDRSVFNRIYTPDGRDVRVESADQFSMYPTILDAVGLAPADGRAGLGVSVFVPDVKYGTFRALSDEERRRLVASRSQYFYDSLWGIVAAATEPQSSDPQATDTQSSDSQSTDQGH